MTLSMTSRDLRRDALEIFRTGVAAADPRAAVAGALGLAASGRPTIAGRELSQGSSLRLLAIGKAAVAMAEGAATVLPPEILSAPGIVVVHRDGHRPLERFRVHVGGHPLPDAASVAASDEVRRYLAGGRRQDAVLVLVSGGGSALLAAPAGGISLADKITTTRLLLACGANINELNALRKHLSELKGGGLARCAAPARIEALILSDVVGDDLGTIASGPTVPDPTTFAEVEEILSRYGLLDAVPGAVRRRLERGLRGEIPETPKPGDPLFERVVNRLVGSNLQSLEAARGRAETLGYRAIVYSNRLTGEARDAGARLAAELERRAAAREAVALLAGGETTVTLRGDGQGGRNQEMALALAVRCDQSRVGGLWVFLSGGTDGRDGPTEAAGGIVDPGTLERIRRAGLDAGKELRANNSHAALRAAGDLLITGPTGTNVADLQVLLVAG